MTVKKIRNAPFHVGNKLHGSKGHAKYGIFSDGVQVGILAPHCGLWTAFDMDNRQTIATRSFGSFSEAKQYLASK